MSGVIRVFSPSAMPHVGSSSSQSEPRPRAASAAEMKSPEHLRAHQMVGVVALLVHALALCQVSIWYQRPWGLTLEAPFDGAIYASTTGGVFGWLWPS